MIIYVRFSAVSVINLYIPILSCKSSLEPRPMPRIPHPSPRTSCWHSESPWSLLFPRSSPWFYGSQGHFQAPYLKMNFTEFPITQHLTHCTYHNGNILFIIRICSVFNMFIYISIVSLIRSFWRQGFCQIHSSKQQEKTIKEKRFSLFLLLRSGHTASQMPSAVEYHQPLASASAPSFPTSKWICALPLKSLLSAEFYNKLHYNKLILLCYHIMGIWGNRTRRDIVALGACRVPSDGSPFIVKC